MKKTGPAVNRSDEFLDLLSRLAAKVETAKSHADQRESTRYLVELESASMIIERLKTLAASMDSRRRINWNAAIEALAFIGKLIDKINAFIYCDIPYGCAI